VTGLVLGLFRRLRGPLRRMGVDHEAFLAILEAKLREDRRRVRFGKMTEGSDSTYLLTLGMYALFGLMLGVSLFGIESPLLALTLVHAVVMMMIGLLLVGDFTSVLVDTADNAVLLPRPVDDRTLLAARTAHIVSYLATFTLALGAGPLILGAFAIHPLFPLVFLVTLSLSLALVVFAVYVVYLLALRRADLESFRDVVLWFQVGLMVVCYGGYQVLPRLMGRGFGGELVLADRPWLLLAPPAWMAGPFELLLGRAGWGELALTGLAVLVPVGCLLLVARVLAPGFVRALAALDSSAAASGKRARPERLGPVARLWARAFARAGEERAAFRALWAIASRDRGFKLATYPGLAIIGVLLASALLTERGGAGSDMGFIHVFTLYLACMVAPMAVMALRMSDQYRAAWAWFVLPLESPGSVLSAGVKVALARVAAPAMAIVGTMLLVSLGPPVLPDLVLVASLLAPLTLLVARLSGGDMPFSRRRTGQQTTQGLSVVLFMVLVGGLGIGHYVLLRGRPLLCLGAAAVVLIATAWAFRRYRRTGWWAVPVEGEFE
jgi:ABC-2 type transport system permease protein